MGRKLVTGSKGFRLVASVIVLVNLFGGCGPSNGGLSNGTAGMAQSGHSLFSRNSKPAACPNHCFAESVYFGRGAVGIDPNDQSQWQIDDCLGPVLEHLRAEGAVVQGKALVIPVLELLDELATLPACSGILVHSSGHLYVVIGVVEIDGQAQVQLVHGNEPAVLASKREILDGGFREAWRLERGPQRISIAVGSAKLEIDAIVQSLGEVHHEEPSETAFLLHNAGNVPLLLVRAESSCSCTTVGGAVGTRLSQGDSYKMTVGLRGNNSPTQRQSPAARSKSSR